LILAEEKTAFTQSVLTQLIHEIIKHLAGVETFCFPHFTLSLQLFYRNDHFQRKKITWWKHKTDWGKNTQLMTTIDLNKPVSWRSKRPRIPLIWEWQS